MAEETTGGVNYGLLGPHSGTQFKPTSLKDVEQYMRDVREIKRKKAEERALQALQTGGTEAMRKSLMSDGFGEMAEPLERQIAQSRQAEVIGTVGNILKMKQAEDAGFIPKGSTDRLFNTTQREVIPPVDEFAPAQSQASAITSKVGETEATIAPGSSMAPISPKYEPVAPPAATKLTADLARMPYEVPKTEPETVQEYGFKFSAKTNPNFVYEPESARRILGLSANPNEETISKYVREKAERETPVIDPMQFSDLSTMGDYRKAQNERKAKIAQAEAKIYEDIRKNADILRQEELSNKSARAGLTGQELGIQAQKREAQKAEREKLQILARNNPELSSDVTSPAEAKLAEESNIKYKMMRDKIRNNPELSPADVIDIAKDYTMITNKDNTLEGARGAIARLLGPNAGREFTDEYARMKNMEPTARLNATWARVLDGIGVYKKQDINKEELNRMLMEVGEYAKANKGMGPAIGDDEDWKFHLEMKTAKTRKNKTAEQAVKEMKDKSKKEVIPAPAKKKDPLNLGL